MFVVSKMLYLLRCRCVRHQGLPKINKYINNNLAEVFVPMHSLSPSKKPVLDRTHTCAILSFDCNF